MGLQVKYFENVDHKFICPHCHGVYVDPVRCKCSHVFCWVCYKRRKKRNKLCLVCSDELELSGEVLPQEWTKELASLKISCTKDCGTTIALEYLNEHFNKDCPYAMATCTNKGCSKKTRRIDLPDHLEKCDFRLVSCCCGIQTRFVEIRAHEVAQKCALKQNLHSIVKKRREMQNVIREHRLDIQKQAFQVDYEQRRLEKMKMSRLALISPQSRATTSMSTRSAPALHQQDKLSRSRDLSSHSAPGPSRFKRGNLKTCVQCANLFSPRKNHDRACQWHQGPVADVFGGTCQACGKLTNMKGCTVGCHVASMQRLRHIESSNLLEDEEIEH